MNSVGGSEKYLPGTGGARAGTNHARSAVTVGVKGTLRNASDVRCAQAAGMPENIPTNRREPHAGTHQVRQWPSKNPKHTSLARG